MLFAQAFSYHWMYRELRAFVRIELTRFEAFVQHLLESELRLGWQSGVVQGLSARLASDRPGILMQCGRRASAARARFGVIPSGR